MSASESNTPMPADAMIGYTDKDWDLLLTVWGEKKFRIKQLKQWIFEKGVDDVSLMTNLSNEMKDRLKNTPIFAGEINHHVKSQDGTQKILLKFKDGSEVESVMIPTEKRITFCISSQVGCAMGCKFCATAKLGIKRNLTAGEILSQVYWLRKLTGNRATHIVYMGMGEPMMNYDNVIHSARVLNAADGFGVGARKITISTVGVPHAIKQFADEDEQFHLAISLHAPNDELRDKLVPVNNKWNIEKIFEAARYFNQKTNRIVTFEYVLLAGVNDLKEHAEELRRIINFPAKINLIPFNDHNNSDFTAPVVARVMFFKNALENLGVRATVRTSRGQDIAAACGQLANEKSISGV